MIDWCRFWLGRRGIKTASAPSEATGEHAFTDIYVESLDLPDIDGALLTALLEESVQAGEAEDWHLSHETAAADMGSTSDGADAHDSACEDCGLDDMPPDTHRCSTSTTCMSIEDPSNWGEDDVVAGGWYLSSDDMGRGWIPSPNLWAADIMCPQRIRN